MSVIFSTAASYDFVVPASLLLSILFLGFLILLVVLILVMLLFKLLMLLLLLSSHLILISIDNHNHLIIIFILIIAWIGIVVVRSSSRVVAVAVVAAASIIPVVVVVVVLGPFEWRSMSGDQVLPQIPFVLHDLLADVASDSLTLDVHVDGMLLQVEAVGEGLEAVGANPRLHTLPAIARVALCVICSANCIVYKRERKIEYLERRRRIRSICRPKSNAACRNEKKEGKDLVSSG